MSGPLELPKPKRKLPKLPSVPEPVSRLETGLRPIVLWIVAAAFLLCQLKHMGILPEIPVASACCEKLALPPIPSPVDLPAP